LTRHDVVPSHYEYHSKIVVPGRYLAGMSLYCDQVKKDMDELLRRRKEKGQEKVRAKQREANDGLFTHLLVMMINEVFPSLFSQLNCL